MKRLCRRAQEVLDFVYGRQNAILEGKTNPFDLRIRKTVINGTKPGQIPGITVQHHHPPNQAAEFSQYKVYIDPNRLKLPSTAVVGR